MADDVRITNMPESGSAERVALELAMRIREIEHPYGKGPMPEPRKYWLSLYSECIRTVRSGKVPT